jgi:alpha-tubulin suppressor-like RCC1 family protein
VPTPVAPSSSPFRVAGVLILSSIALGAMLAWTPSAAATTPVVVAISAGGNHTCAITNGGAVKCWGYNGQGQLGDGTIVNSSTPEDVSGLSSGVAAISAGANHTCAVTTSGGVRCWGANYAGQLGDGTATNRSRPVDVSGLTSGVVAISAGGQHTCALSSAGGVKCWGANFSGQLGDGTTTDRSTPVDVSGLTSAVVAISAGGPHTCVLTSTGGVKCWGDNGRGELGDGTTTNSSTPVDVVGLSVGVTAISGGDEKHTCAVATSGGATCWGFNGSGQLGNGTLADSPVPVAVSGLGSGVAAIDGGGFHTCGVTSGGGAKCWGAGSSGQLGNGFPGIDSSTPVAVSGLSSGVGALSAGEYHSCALTTDGSVECWGYNGFGQLGDGTTTNAFSPVVVVSLSSAGSVNGTGWIVPGGPTSDIYDSLPQGLDGKTKASFSFKAQYKSATSTTPTGFFNMSYGSQFKLQSESLDWLVVTGSDGVIQGTATIKDMPGTFLFQVALTDGASTGTTDRLELRVWPAGSDPFRNTPLFQATGDAGGQIQIQP